MGLLINMKLEDEVIVGNVTLKLIQVRGRSVKLKFDGPTSTKILRKFKESSLASGPDSSSQINQLCPGAGEAHLSGEIL